MQSPHRLRILVVDDEAGMRRLLRLGLAADGHTVSETDRGMGVLEAVRRRETDLIMLDLGLPDLDGLQVIKRLRHAMSHIPIVLYPHYRAVELRRTDGQSGRTRSWCGKYITKPFGIEELLARIRVLQRYRVQPRSDQTVLTAGEMELDMILRNVIIRGREVKLSPREYELLRLFMTHAGKVLTHGLILRQVWGTKETAVQYLPIYIRALRQKIEHGADQPSLIVTEPGVGYRLRADEKTDQINDDSYQAGKQAFAATTD